MPDTPVSSDDGKRRDDSARDAVESAAYDITDAIERLAAAVAQNADLSDDTVVDSYGDFYIFVGDLRAILAALSAPYVPGMVKVEDRSDFDDDASHALLTVWAAPTFRPVQHSFVQVSR